MRWPISHCNWIAEVAHKTNQTILNKHFLALSSASWLASKARCVDSCQLIACHRQPGKVNNVTHVYVHCPPKTSHNFTCCNVPLYRSKMPVINWFVSAVTYEKAGKWILWQGWRKHRNIKIGCSRADVSSCDWLNKIDFLPAGRNRRISLLPDKKTHNI